MGYKATIFNIQHFSLHDGPGIRTTVFMKGCTLRCFWCHNPESFIAEPQIQFFESKCLSCGQCAKACPNASDGKRALFTSSCTMCGECVKKCYAQALIRVGREIPLLELYNEIAADRDLYEKSGGGVTFTGGEPLLQHSFLLEIMKMCKRDGINTAIETAGNVDYPALERLLPYLDYIFYDIKVLDGQKHLAATGVSNERIIHNLELLGDTDKAFTVRIPIIPGFNDNESDMRNIAQWLISLNHIPPVELLAFHGICVGKYESLNMDYPANYLSTPTIEKLQKLADIFRAMNITVKTS